MGQGQADARRGGLPPLLRRAPALTLLRGSTHLLIHSSTLASLFLLCAGAAGA